MSASSDLKYCPMSAWWKATTVEGSACRQSWVDLAATPKPFTGENTVQRSIPSVSVSRQACAHQWQVIHREEDHSLILLCALCNAAQARLLHVVAIEKLLFSASLQPHLALHTREKEKCNHMRHCSSAGICTAAPWRTVTPLVVL